MLGLGRRGASYKAMRLANASANMGSKFGSDFILQTKRSMIGSKLRLTM